MAYIVFSYFPYHPLNASITLVVTPAIFKLFLALPLNASSVHGFKPKKKKHGFLIEDFGNEG